MDLLNKLSPPEFGPLFTKPGWLAKIISTNRDLYRKCESDVFYKKKAHILSIRTSSNTADISDLKWSVAALHDHLPRWPRDPDQPLDHQLHPHRAPAILPPHQLLLDVCWRFVWSLIKLATLTDLFLGLYLFLQVQASFSVGRLKLRHCVSIGWGNNNNQWSQAFLTTSYPWAVSWPVAWHFLTNYPLVLGNFQPI